MSGTWSGAIIYEWIEEANDYGLVSYGPQAAATATGANIEGGYTRGGTPTPVSPDFDNLKSQWATLTPSSVAESAYNPSLTDPPCPSFTSGLWMVNGGVSLPTLNQEYNAQVSSSITAGTAAAGATGTGSSGHRGAGSASSSSSSGVSSRAMPEFLMNDGLVFKACAAVFAGVAALAFAL